MSERLAEETREELERSLRVPGIIFVDGPAGRRARIAGTGIEVFEVIQVYQMAEGDFELLMRQFHWLLGDQLLAALDYYRLYPSEVDAMIAEGEALMPPEIRAAVQAGREASR